MPLGAGNMKSLIFSSRHAASHPPISSTATPGIRNHFGPKPEAAAWRMPREMRRRDVGRNDGRDHRLNRFHSRPPWVCSRPRMRVTSSPKRGDVMMSRLRGRGRSTGKVRLRRCDPGCADRTTTRSARKTASVMEWVMMMMVGAFPQIPSSSLLRASRVKAWKAPNGSSSSDTRG